MLKSLFIVSLLLLTISNCQKATITEPFDFDRDTPQWLKVKIDSMAADQSYFGTMVYRYEWHGDFVYHIMIPISSCAYCELYDRNGTKIRFANDDAFTNFHHEIKNELIIWEWKEQ